MSDLADRYFERRTEVSQWDDDQIRRELKAWRTQRTKARKEDKFAEWSEAVEWIEVLEDELEHRANPGIAEDADTTS